MTRRALSRLLVSVSLVLASLAWTGFTLQRTVFDSTRSERVLRVLLDDETVRHALLQQVVSKADAAMPAELRAQVSLEQLTAAASQVLDDPRVRTTVEQALVDSHRYVIGDLQRAPTLDTTLLDAVVREKVNGVRPDLGQLIPPAQQVVIELPASGLAVVHRFHDVTAALTPLLAMAALCGLLAALVISNDRAGVLRRVGFWALSLGAVWIVLRFALPLVIESVLGDGGAILAALSDAIAGGMGVPGTLLFVAGLALVGASVAVGAAERATAAGDGGRRTARHARRPSRPQQARSTGVRSEATTAAPAARAEAPTAGAPVVAPAEVIEDPRTYAPPPRSSGGVNTPGPHPGAPAIPVVAIPSGSGPSGSGPSGSGPSGSGPSRAMRSGSGPEGAMPSGAGSVPLASNPVVPSVAVPAAAARSTDPAPPAMPAPPLRHQPGGRDLGEADATAVLPVAEPAAPTQRLTVADRPVVPLTGDGSDPDAAISIPLPRRNREGRAAGKGADGGTDRGAGPAATEVAPAEGDAAPGAARRGPQADGTTRTTPRPAPNEWLGGFSMNPGDHPRVADPAPAPPRWIEGVGYVYDYAPTDSARWIDGLGYVLDED